MADTEKSKHIQTPRPPMPLLRSLPTSGLERHQESRNQEKEAWRGGCAAAGLNPHVSSECQPCSQWLSSAATGPGADIQRGLKDSKAAKLLLEILQKEQANKQTQGKN